MNGTWNPESRFNAATPMRVQHMLDHRARGRIGMDDTQMLFYSANHRQVLRRMIDPQEHNIPGPYISRRNRQQQLRQPCLQALGIGTVGLGQLILHC